MVCPVLIWGSVQPDVLPVRALHFRPVAWVEAVWLPGVRHAGDRIFAPQGPAGPWCDAPQELQEPEGHECSFVSEDPAWPLCAEFQTPISVPDVWMKPADSPPAAGVASAETVLAFGVARCPHSRPERTLAASWVERDEAVPYLVRLVLRLAVSPEVMQEKQAESWVHEALHRPPMWMVAQVSRRIPSGFLVHRAQ